MAGPDPHEEPRTWLRLKDAAQVYDLPYQCLYQRYRRGLVRGRRTPAGVLVDAASIEEALLPPGWEWLSEALKRCGLGRYVVLRLIRAGRLRARRVRQRWQVETASLEECARERALPAGWVGTSDAGRRLGVGRQEIRRRIRAGQLRAEKRGRRWAVAESSIEEQLPPPGWITTQEAARRTGWASSTIGLRIHKGQVVARKIGKRWFVEERSLLAPAAPREAGGE